MRIRVTETRVVDYTIDNEQAAIIQQFADKNEISFYSAAIELFEDGGLELDRNEVVWYDIDDIEVVED